MGFGRACKIFSQEISALYLFLSYRNTESTIWLFRDFTDLEDVLELEEDVVSLCFVSNSANAALPRASAASGKSLSFSSSNDFSKCFKLRFDDLKS